MLLLRVAIVENEEDVAKKDVLLLERYAKEKNISLETETFLNAFNFLESKKDFDVVLMDIDMPGINGMQAAEELRKTNKNIDIIFTTNLPQFAVDGYKVQAIDFVVKPITFTNLSFAMDKIREKKGNAENGTFFLKIGGGVRRFNNSDIIYFEMSGHSLIIHKENEEPFKMRGALKVIEKSLNPEVFAKINSGIIINLSKVVSFEEGIVLLEDGSRLPISRSHKKEFATKLTRFYGNNFEEIRNGN